MEPAPYPIILDQSCEKLAGPWHVAFPQLNHLDSRESSGLQTAHEAPTAPFFGKPLEHQKQLSGHAFVYGYDKLPLLVNNSRLVERFRM